jgi:hypothetical protein
MQKKQEDILSVRSP